MTLKKPTLALLFAISLTASGSAFASISDRVLLVPATTVFSSENIFLKPGLYKVTCRLETSLTKGEGIRWRYDNKDRQPDPTSTKTFDNQHKQISFSAALVDPSTYNPASQLYSVFYEYTTSKNFSPVWADCTYTLNS